MHRATKRRPAGDVSNPCILYTKKKPDARSGFFFGGATGIRTLDLLHAMQALYQLSYSPIFTRENITRYPVPRQGLVDMEDGDNGPGEAGQN